MNIQKRFKFHKHCPHLGKETDFYVDYEYINLCGDSHTHSVKVGFSCPSSYECPLENTNDCPLFHKAPEGMN